MSTEEITRLLHQQYKFRIYNNKTVTILWKPEPHIIEILDRNLVGGFRLQIKQSQLIGYTHDIQPHDSSSSLVTRDWFIWSYHSTTTILRQIMNCDMQQLVLSWTSNIYYLPFQFLPVYSNLKMCWWCSVLAGTNRHQTLPGRALIHRIMSSQKRNYLIFLYTMLCRFVMDLNCRINVDNVSLS